MFDVLVPDSVGVDAFLSLSDAILKEAVNQRERAFMFVRLLVDMGEVQGREVRRGRGWHGSHAGAHRALGFELDAEERAAWRARITELESEE